MTTVSAEEATRPTLGNGGAVVPSGSKTVTNVVLSVAPVSERRRRIRPARLVLGVRAGGGVVAQCGIGRQRQVAEHVQAHAGPVGTIQSGRGGLCDPQLALQGELTVRLDEPAPLLGSGYPGGR